MGKQRTNHSMAEFLRELYLKDEDTGEFVHQNAQSLADALGMTKNSVTAKCSKLRQKYDVREFSRGGTPRINEDSVNSLLAKLAGRDINEVKRAGEKRKVATAQRAAEREASENASE